MSSSESTQKTLLVALCLCLVCSILVSASAVVLKPMQDANRILDRNKNILGAAGEYDAAVNGDDEVDALFAQFTPYVVDLKAGQVLGQERLAELGIDLATYDQRRVITSPELSEAIPRQADQANIKRRALYPMVYVKQENDRVDTVVLPIEGYGLWGILYGFIALEGDANTVKGLSFYELKETPGLGAEVRNPSWKALWPGKQLRNENGEVTLRVVKGEAVTDQQIDGLAGATLTTQGVDNLLQYWLGSEGFGPLLDKLARGELL